MGLTGLGLHTLLFITLGVSSAPWHDWEVWQCFVVVLMYFVAGCAVEEHFYKISDTDDSKASKSSEREDNSDDNVDLAKKPAVAPSSERTGNCHDLLKNGFGQRVYVNFVTSVSIIIVVFVFADNATCNPADDSTANSPYGTSVAIMGRTCSSGWAFLFTNVVALTLTFFRRNLVFKVRQLFRHQMMETKKERQHVAELMRLDVVDQITWFVSITLLISQNLRIFFSIAVGSLEARYEYLKKEGADQKQFGDLHGNETQYLVKHNRKQSDLNFYF